MQADDTATTSNQQDLDSKVGALKRARAIWGKTAGSSKEATHAAKVLDTILARVSDPHDGGNAEGASSPRGTTDGGRRFTSASASASASTEDATVSSNPSPADMRQCGTPPIQAGWMAVNHFGLSRKITGGQIKEWDFGFDDIDKRLAARKSGCQFGVLLGNDVDWVRNLLFSYIYLPFLVTSFSTSHCLSCSLLPP